MRGGELRPAPPRTPGAAGAARREAPGARCRGADERGATPAHAPPPCPGPAQGPPRGRPPAQDWHGRASEPGANSTTWRPRCPGPPSSRGDSDPAGEAEFPRKPPPRHHLVPPPSPPRCLRPLPPPAAPAPPPRRPRGPTGQRQRRRGPRFPAVSGGAGGRSSEPPSRGRHSPEAAAVPSPGLRQAHSAKAPRRPVLPRRPSELLPPTGTAERSG